MNVDKDRIIKSTQRDLNINSRIPLSEISSSGDKIFSKTGKLIKLIDDLRECGVVNLDFDLRLPRVCILGRPSCGKSSIINSLIGIDLLPRGENIVTRCPIELKMKHIPFNTKIKPYCEIYLDGISKEGRYDDFSQAKQILNDSLKIKTGYSKDAIKILIFSNSCSDVTIVDLPGVSDEDGITRDIAYNYLKDESSVILYAINTSDEDVQKDLVSEMRNDRMLSLIGDVDEDFSRTIGIFTKIDTISNNTPNTCELFQNIKKYLNNEIDQDDTNTKKNLKCGYVAVKNISTNDKTTLIDNNAHIEREYFKSHNSFKFSSSEHTTVEALADKLKKVFYSDKTIINNIVNIHTQLKTSTQKCQTELSKFGVDYLIYTSESKHTYIASLINIFSDTLEKIFSSKMSRIEENLMNHKLKEMYSQFLKQYIGNYDPSSNMINEEIIKIIKLTEGDRLSGFPEADVVCSLLVNEIEILREEVKSFIEEVNDLVLGIVKDTAFKIFCRFPPLMDKIEELMNLFCNENAEKMRYIIDSIAEMNFNYLYLDEQCLSYHKLLQNFVLSNDDVDECSHVRDRSNTTSNKRQNSSDGQNYQNAEGYYNGLAKYIKILINHFYSIIVRNLRESVPKATGKYFLNILKDETRFYLLKELTSDILSYESYLEEDPEVMEKRNYYIDLMKTLKNCDKMFIYDEDVRFVIKKDRRTSINTILKKNLSKNIFIHHLLEQNSSSAQPVTQNNNSNPSIPTANKEYRIDLEPSKNTVYNPQTSRKFFTDESDTATSQAKISSTNSNYTSNTNNINLKQTSNTTTNNNFINLNNSSHPKTEINSAQVKTEYAAEKMDKAVASKEVGNISIKLDPSGDIKDAKLKVDMDAETAWNFIQNNKKYLPTTQQVVSGAKATANFVEKTGNKLNEYDGGERANIPIMEKDSLVTGNKMSQTKKATDPLTMANLFGLKKDNPPTNKSTTNDKNTKKGIF